MQDSRDNNPSSPKRQPPYAPSPVIKAIEWAPVETIQRHAQGVGRGARGRGKDGSDNWPLTWADDDCLYAAWGDGHGFDPQTPEKLGCGFARISGEPEDCVGENIRSDGENPNTGRSGKKGSGMLMVEGALYMWNFHADEQGGQAQLACSRDYAKTWTFADWKFAEFGLCAFINFGKNYEGARNGYAYTVTHDGPLADTPADRMILMRAPKDRILERSATEFFTGLDANGAPQWSADIDERGAVFEHPDTCLRSGISYNAPLKRYLWWQHIPQPEGHKDRGDTRFDGGFAIYDAPEPWGPWTTAYFTEQWDVGPGERAEFPPKWISADGRTCYLVFSGDDNFSIRKATLSL